MCRSLNRESWRRPAYALSPVECLGQALQSSEDRVSGQPAALGSCGMRFTPASVAKLGKRARCAQMCKVKVKRPDQIERCYEVSQTCQAR